MRPSHRRGRSSTRTSPSPTAGPAPGFCGCLPCIQPCLCCSRLLGDQARAAAFNEPAAAWKPEDPAVLHSRVWFQPLAAARSDAS